MKIVRFKAEHLASIQRTGTGAEWLSPGDVKRLEGTRAFTGLVGDKVVGCGGAVELWPGRFAVWAYFATDARRYWKSVHKAVRAFLFSLPARRIEADVAFGFEAGLRWAKRLGFVVECPRRAGYFADGGDAVSLALVKGG